MKRYYLFPLIVGMLNFPISPSYAAIPKFNIVPVSGTVTSLVLPRNFTETITYQVTNQTNITRTLTMVSIPGVTQTVSGSGVCPNPFTLGPQQSCNLVLVVDGSQVSASGIHSGPEVCKTKSATDPSPDPFLCSTASTENMLSISPTTTLGQHAYIANQLDNSISFCQANPVSGFLSNCSVTATGLSAPEGIGFNPSKTFFYAANPGNSTITICQVNQTTGVLSNCGDAGGSGFNLPDAVSFSPDGTIFYTSNFGDNTVSACLVNATTGLLSGCINNPSPTFSAPGDMTINSAGNLAYVVNRTANTTSVCTVSGQTVNNCIDSSGSLFNNPEGVTLSPSGLQAFIANAGSKSVTVCDILQDGTGLLTNCFITNTDFVGTGNVGLNTQGSFAYVPNQATSDVFVCNVDLVTGAFSSCTRTIGGGFSVPAGVALN